jgi:hypothetical protein
LNELCSGFACSRDACVAVFPKENKRATQASQLQKRKYNRPVTFPVQLDGIGRVGISDTEPTPLRRCLQGYS